MAEQALWMNPVNRVNALELVNAQQAKVLQMQAEYAESAFDTSSGTYEDMRKAYNEERKMWNVGGPQMVFSQDIEFAYEGGTVKTRLIKATDAPNQPILFYTHGGGYVLGNNDTHSLVQRKLAAYADVAVVGIDYSLSPEAVYPTAVNEGTAAIRYFTEHAAEYGLDASRIAFAGDSGGANLSFAYTIKLRDEGFDMSVIKGELLYYGTYGLSDSISAHLHGGAWDGMSEADLEFYWNMYLGKEADVKTAKYFNLYVNDLTHDIPPCFFFAAELDPLRDDSRLMWEVLKRNGFDCEYKEYAGVLHAFLIYNNVMDDAEDALKTGAEFLKKRM